nr:hypothetical protein [Nocardia inohanensis]
MQPVEDIVTVVGDGGAPAQFGAVCHGQVQQCVGGFDAADAGDFGEGQADDGRVRAGHDFGVVEVPMPDPGAEPFGHIPAESAEGHR